MLRVSDDQHAELAMGGRGCVVDIIEQGSANADWVGHSSGVDPPVRVLGASVFFARMQLVERIAVICREMQGEPPLTALRHALQQQQQKEGRKGGREEGREW
jgi:hypothetical protein